MNITSNVKITEPCTVIGPLIAIAPYYKVDALVIPMNRTFHLIYLRREEKFECDFGIQGMKIKNLSTSPIIVSIELKKPIPNSFFGN